MWPIFVSYKPKYGSIYMLSQGKYIGSFLVYIKEQDNDNEYAFLLMPDPTKALYIKKTEFEDYLERGIITFEKKLPVKVYKSCLENFKYYKKEQ